MTAAERRFWEAVQSRTKLYEPELRRAIVRGFATVRLSLKSTDALVEYIGSGAMDVALSEIVPDAVLEGAFAEASKIVQRRAIQSANTEGRTIPRGRAGRVMVGFDILNPDVVAAIQILDTKVMQTLKDGVREVVRKRIQLGLENGEAPRTIARDLRNVIGMAPNQLEAVTNFQQLLITGDREALSRGLRDHRFDATLEKSLGVGGTGLTDSQISTMVSAYSDRMLAFNAEVNARTATVDALKLGQRLGWDDAVEKGIVDPERLVKRWVGVMDSRERPSHVAMEGEEVPYDSVFSNGQTIPGDTEFNCRCVAFYFQGAKS